ncbi:hypothetical protein [Falsiroseomonas oryziterrae]|uniref:hypothetical protein n=1 Tax=Falsiroseomonas oryziterrae TaxID=2911368 RepID=UPI001F481B19|nr:hypothetical protein [Roseomonas sp. NPKOSM-4]
MRRRPVLTVLLAGLFLLQWGTAFAHCLRLAAPQAALVVEICTQGGLHRVVLPGEPEQGQPTPVATPACPVCLGAGSAGLPSPDFEFRSPVRLAQASDPPPPSPPPPAPLPPRSCQPRAPPTS